jgi:putative tryptophan/tyrosine transport system substrate-binding protein
MRRRDFITLLGGAVAVWPLTARTQTPQRMRRIGVLMNFAIDDPEALSRLAALHQGLQEGGWAVGRNLLIDYRWGAGDAGLARRYAMELVALMPDVILATSSSTVPYLLQSTRSVPIVFAQTPDPVGAGFVASLAHPGGNVTGFTNFEYSIGGKLLDVLKKIAPRVTQVAVLRDSVDPAGVGQWGAIQTAAPSFGVDVVSVAVQGADEIEHGITAFANGTNAANRGLIVLGSSPTAVHRELIISLAAQHQLPTIYQYRYNVTSGGLMSYGPDIIEQFRGAAGYISRILKGEKAADLPVQAPTKYELVINLKAAKALGLTVPATLLAIADEVIE